MLFYLVNLALSAYVAANYGGPLHWLAFGVAAIWTLVIYSIIRRITDGGNDNDQ